MNKTILKSDVSPHTLKQAARTNILVEYLVGLLEGNVGPINNLNTVVYELVGEAKLIRSALTKIGNNLSSLVELEKTTASDNLTDVVKTINSLLSEDPGILLSIRDLLFQAALTMEERSYPSAALEDNLAVSTKTIGSESIKTLSKKKPNINTANTSTPKQTTTTTTITTENIVNYENGEFEFDFPLEESAEPSGETIIKHFNPALVNSVPIYKNYGIDYELSRAAKVPRDSARGQYILKYYPEALYNKVASLFVGCDEIQKATGREMLKYKDSHKYFPRLTYYIYGEKRIWFGFKEFKTAFDDWNSIN